MSFWSFIVNWFKRVFYVGWDAVDYVHRGSFATAILTAFFTAHHAGPEGEHDMLTFSAVILAAAILGSLGYCAWRLCKEEYDKRIALEAFLTPKLEFAGIGEKAHEIYRVRIRNLSPQSIWFKTHLMRISPPIDVVMPFVLQPTHRRGEEGEIIGGEYGTADVFVDHKTSLRLLPGSPVGAPTFPRKDRYELVLCATCRECPPVYRRYYILLQSVGGFIFPAGGVYGPPGVPGGPTAGQTAIA
jgi:hypothetical protein